MDERDREILRMLLGDGGVSQAAIADDLGIPPSVVSDRIRRMEREGVITGRCVRVDPARLDRPLLAFVYLSDLPDRRTLKGLGEIPGVEAVHTLAGEDCVHIAVRTRDTATLARRLDAIIEMTGARTKTYVALETLHEALPLENDELDESREEIAP